MRLSKRYYEALEMFDAGIPAKDIATKLGISRGRVYQMTRKARRVKETHNQDLSVRAINVLSALGMPMTNELASQTSDRLTYSDILEAANSGRKTADEVRQWLGSKGLPMLERQKNPVDPNAATKTEQRYIDYLSKRGYIITKPNR